MLRIPARTRAVTTGVALLLSATLLSACDKPLPGITVFTGSTSKAVAAQPKCVVLTTGSCAVDQGKITDLTAKSGGQILVDVPKNLADAGWVVAAFTTDSAGKNTPIDGAGSLPVHGDHSIRLNVPLSTGGYFLQIAPIPSPKLKKQLTTWLVKVNLSQ